MNLIDELLKVGAKAVLEVKKVSTEKAGQRMAICRNCPNFNADKIKCKACGCYLEVKTECETNYNPKKLRHEVTHCPHGLWNDAHVANEYRKLDGLPLINIELNTTTT
jgi:hypothetical protein